MPPYDDYPKSVSGYKTQDAGRPACRAGNISRVIRNFQVTSDEDGGPSQHLSARLQRAGFLREVIFMVPFLLRWSGTILYVHALPLAQDGATSHHVANMRSSSS
jgi:hypothetical protein